MSGDREGKEEGGRSPGEAFHLREIARITATQPGTLRRELALLADAGVR